MPLSISSCASLIDALAIAILSDAVRRSPLTFNLILEFLVDHSARMIAFARLKDALRQRLWNSLLFEFRLQITMRHKTSSPEVTGERARLIYPAREECPLRSELFGQGYHKFIEVWPGYFSCRSLQLWHDIAFIDHPFADFLRVAMIRRPCYPLL